MCGYRYAYFGGLFVDLLPMIKTNMPSLLAPSLECFKFMVGGFNGTRSTAVTTLFSDIFWRLDDPR